MNKNRTVAYNMVSTVVLQGLAFFTIPVFSRILGPYNYGIVSVYSTWVSIASIIFSMQTHSSLVVARNKYKYDEQLTYQKSTILISLIVYMFLSCITIVFDWMFKFASLIWVICILIQGWGTFCVTFLNSKFTYEFKANLNAILSITISVSTIILSLLFINFYPSSFWGRIVGMVIPYGMIGISTPFFFINKSKTFINIEYAIFAMRISIPIIFHSLANLVLAQSDRLMIQFFSSSKDVGIYSLVYSFVSVLSIIWGALNNSFAPFYYEDIKNHKKEKILASSKNYIELYTILTCGFILLSKEVYTWFADEKYYDGLMLIPILVLGNYFVFMYSFFVNYEIANEKTKMIACNTVIAAIVNIILNYILIEKMGIQGAAIATIAAYGTQCLIHYIYAKRIDSDFALPIEIKAFVLPLLLVFITMCCFYYMNGHLYIRWIVAIILGIYSLYSILKRKSIF